MKTKRDKTQEQNPPLTKGQRKIQRALRTLDDCAWYFEERGLQSQADIFNEAMDDIEALALSLEALGLPSGVLDDYRYEGARA